uniref:Uncharacterized protein n=1 Tax=Anguilla anguilla TaxID=7936 RepID=A0A0E9VUE9_ANGAN
MTADYRTYVCNVTKIFI